METTTNNNNSAITDNVADVPWRLTVSAEVTSRKMACRRTARHHDSPLRPQTAAETHAPATSDGGLATNLKSANRTLSLRHRPIRDLYDVIKINSFKQADKLQITTSVLRTPWSVSNMCIGPMVETICKRL